GAELQGVDVTYQSRVEASLRDDPLARAVLWTLAGLALVGFALALAGLAVSVTTDLRDERGELFDLSAQGARPSALRRHVRLLAGLDRPSAGSVRVYGTDLARLPARRLDAYRAETVGYVDQHYVRSLAPELTAGELVALQLGLAGEPRAERRAQALDLLGRVGLEGRADAHAAELS